MTMNLDQTTNRVMPLEFTLQGRFEKYHEDNPKIYSRFKELARALFYRGRKKIGAKLIMERIRWDTVIGGNDEFKINNDYTSRYVRMLIDEQPYMRNLFALRELKA